MERDTEELASIIGELGESMSKVGNINETLRAARTSHECHEKQLSKTLQDLDELADIMFEIVNRQNNVEVFRATPYPIGVLTLIEYRTKVQNGSRLLIITYILSKNSASALMTLKSPFQRFLGRLSDEITTISECERSSLVWTMNCANYGKRNRRLGCSSTRVGEAIFLTIYVCALVMCPHDGKSRRVQANTTNGYQTSMTHSRRRYDLGLVW
jgi:hypothetical protein